MFEFNNDVLFLSLLTFDDFQHVFVCRDYWLKIWLQITNFLLGDSMMLFGGNATAIENQNYLSRTNFAQLVLEEVQQNWSLMGY